MRNYVLRLILLILALWCQFSYAQDPQLSLFYALPTALNPAFAGGSHHHRVMVHHRDQWPANDARYTTSYASFDTYFAKQKLGIGGVVMSDNQGFATLKTTTFEAIASYELNLTNKLTFRPGLSLGFGQKKLADGLTYNDQFNEVTGFSGKPSNESFPTSRILYPEVGTGFLLYTSNFWVGLSGKHLNMPSMSFLGNGPDSRLPLSYNFHAGIKIPLIHTPHMAYLEDERDISITPVIHYKGQGKADQLDLGLYGIYDQLLIGAWFRGLPLIKSYNRIPNTESMVLMAGWNFGEVTLTYSYDLQASKLRGYTNGAHEINLTYIFQKKHKSGHAPMKRLPCPNLHHPHKHH